MCIRKRKVALMKLTLYCVCVSFSLQIIGFLCPFWLEVITDASNMSATNYSVNVTENFSSKNESENFYTLYDIETFDSVNDSFSNGSLVSIHRNFGLWYVFTCIDLNCTLGEYPDWNDAVLEITDVNHNGEYGHGYNFSWIDVRVPIARQNEFLIEVMLGITILFVALIQVWHHKKIYEQEVFRTITDECHSYRHWASITCLVISGVLIWIPVTEYMNVNSKFKKLIHQEEYVINDIIYNKVSVGTPFSLLFSGSGIVLTAFACLLIVLIIYFRRGVVTSRPNNEIPLNVRRNENTTFHNSANASNVMDGVGNAQHLRIPSVLSPCANTANNEYCYAAGIEEDPPPSYEEAMQLYVKTDG